MYISLDGFEQVIPNTILERGLKYFENGKVTELTELSPGEYEARVLGSDAYSVSLTVEDRTITWYNCDCPYDYGPICKHVAAVIFALQEDELQFNITGSRMEKRKGKPKSISMLAQVKDVLKKIPHEELKTFVEEMAKRDDIFRNHFLSSFVHLSGDQLSKDFFKKQIKAVLKLAAGRNNYISWNEMPVLVAGLTPILEKIEHHFENKNFSSVFYSSTALLEEMTAALDYTDDSNGEIGFHTDFAHDMLYKIAAEDLPKDLHIDLFKYCIASYKSNIFSGWDWHLGMLELAAETVKDAEEAAIILKLLDTEWDRYDRERAQALQLSLIQTYKSKEEAEDFIKAHIANPKIRRSEIEKAIQNSNFDRAIGLAETGIKHDEKEYPGLAKEWKDWLLKIAEAQNDIPLIIKYAREAYLDSFMSRRDYYQLLKNSIAVEDWPGFVNELVREIKKGNVWGKSHLLRDIYIREKCWDELYASISKNPSFNEIDSVEEYLAQDYANELVELYARTSIAFLEENVGRKHYREVCRYLRRMKKLGGDQKLKKLLSFFTETYNRRPALLEELAKV